MRTGFRVGKVNSMSRFPDSGNNSDPDSSRNFNDNSSSNDSPSPDFVFDLNDYTAAQQAWWSNEIPEPYVAPDHIFRLNLFRLRIQEVIRNRLPPG